MNVVHLPAASASLNEVLADLPAGPAVFLLWAAAGEPYLARTNVFRRRLTRMLGEAGPQGSRTVNLRGTVERIEYQVTGSVLESQMVMLEAAKKHFPTRYREAVRLRMPPYVKLVLTNRFPRTQIVRQLGRAKAVYFGPFRARASAARFEAEFLDLFQLRRCQDDLVPSPEHPGCMYGEMGRCLRPCQAAVDGAVYRSEARRVADFLHTSGMSLLHSAEAARDRFSAELDFEGAALMHQRLQKIEEVLSFRDEMARDIDAMNAAAIVPASEPGKVAIGRVQGGYWQGFRELNTGDKPDAELRSLCSGFSTQEIEGDHPSPRERAEHLAVLSKWFCSSWCDGELLFFDSWEKPPYRKLLNAAARVSEARSARRKPRRSSRSSPPDSPPA